MPNKLGIKENKHFSRDVRVDYKITGFIGYYSDRKSFAPPRCSDGSRSGHKIQMKLAREQPITLHINKVWPTFVGDVRESMIIPERIGQTLVRNAATGILPFLSNAHAFTARSRKHRDSLRAILFEIYSWRSIMRC